jgi:hypothetical protein
MGYFKKFGQIVFENNLKYSGELKSYNELMEILDSLPVHEESESGIINWLWYAPKVKRLMHQANELRIDKIKLERDTDAKIDAFNDQLEKEIDTYRENMKAKIASTKNQDVKDKYREALADHPSEIKKDYKSDIDDLQQEYDRKTDAIDDDISAIEDVVDGIIGSSDYLSRIKAVIKMQGTIEANKLRIEFASADEAKKMAAKNRELSKKIEDYAEDIKGEVEKSKRYGKHSSEADDDDDDVLGSHGISSRH